MRSRMTAARSRLRRHTRAQPVPQRPHQPGAACQPATPDCQRRDRAGDYHQHARQRHAASAVSGRRHRRLSPESVHRRVSLQLATDELTRRLSKGLQLLASYTYAKSLDNASGRGETDASTILGNQFDSSANRGVSDFDRTHRFVLSYLWDLPRPAFAARSRPDGYCCPTGKWPGSSPRCPVSRLTSWTPPRAPSISVQTADYPGPTGQQERRATRRPPTSRLDTFFNPFAFVRPVVQAGQVIPSSNGVAVAGAQGTDIGNVGRNVLRGPNK